MNLFNNLNTLQKSLVVSILSIMLFILSASSTYSIFSRSTVVKNIEEEANIPGVGEEVAEDPSEPKTEECPLNGQMFTKKTKNLWEGRVPLAVMIENHLEARPQSGLSYANVVYEAIAEGGITRFMGLYLCIPGDVQVGPVRSARTYFLDWLSEYNALYGHVGGANTPGPADALSQIIKYKIRDLNQFSIGFPTFWRDYQRLGKAVATEHTMYSTTEKLWAIGTKKNLVVTADVKDWNKDFIMWKYKDDFENKSKAKGIDKVTDKIDVNFWQGFSDYSVRWDYDKECNCYKRTNGEVAHTDLDNKKQLTAKNVIIQFQRESRANDGYENNVHLLYKTTGKGDALIFQDGKVLEGKWSKDTRLDRSIYTDAKGNEIYLNRGVIWIQTVPEGASVSY